MGILKIVEWKDESKNTIVHRIDLKKDYVNRGSKLVVRESQVCVFSDKGRMADVFLPGTYTLETDNIPIITKLLSWKYGFESPFKSDIFYVNTKQFTGNNWGTKNPIIIRDNDFGAVRVRGFGKYSFKVKDAYVFMSELSGTNSSYKTDEIVEWIKSKVVTHITDAIGEAHVPILDMASNLVELGEIVQKNLEPSLEKIGITLTDFTFENFSMPEELEKALDEQTKLGMMRKNIDVYTQMGQVEALKTAAGNPGTAGTMIGAGIGLGMGANMGAQFSNMTKPVQEEVKPSKPCPHCGKQVQGNPKFCPECGKPMAKLCPKCGATVSENAKFCPECGQSLRLVCPNCQTELKPGSKFCPECGTKIE